MLGWVFYIEVQGPLENLWIYSQMSVIFKSEKCWPRGIFTWNLINATKSDNFTSPCVWNAEGHSGGNADSACGTQRLTEERRLNGALLHTAALLRWLVGFGAEGLSCSLRAAVY